MKDKEWRKERGKKKTKKERHWKSVHIGRPPNYSIHLCNNINYNNISSFVLEVHWQHHNTKHASYYLPYTSIPVLSYWANAHDWFWTCSMGAYVILPTPLTIRPPDSDYNSIKQHKNFMFLLSVHTVTQATHKPTANQTHPAETWVYTDLLCKIITIMTQHKVC